MLLGALCEIGVVRQFVEERGHHGVAVHLLLQESRDNICVSETHLKLTEAAGHN